MTAQYPNPRMAHIHYMVIDATNAARAERRYFTLYDAYSGTWRNLGSGLR